MPNRFRRRDRIPSRVVAVHALERRVLLSVAPDEPTVRVRVDYGYDTNNFFDTQAKRDLLQRAADTVVAPFRDRLLGINPGSGNSWSASFDHPSAGTNVSINNLTVPEGEYVLFAGAQEQTTSLARGGPGGYNVSGSPSWLDRVAGRGQSGALDDDEDDFGPWGGSITFDLTPSGGWHFGETTLGIGSKNDFYSVALHEIAHALGFGASDAWSELISSGKFQGAASNAEFDGAGPGIPLSLDMSHWASGTTDGGREAVMDPELTSGTRKELTALDYAGLDDMGWDLPVTAVVEAVDLTAAGGANHTFTVTYSHYSAVDTASLGADDVTVITPDGASIPAALVGVNNGVDGTPRVATYSVAAPGGVWDSTDNGTYTVRVNDSAAASAAIGSPTYGGDFGSFDVTLAAPPSASLSVANVTGRGAATHAFTVTYSDAGAVEASSIDAADVVVTRASDGLVLDAAAAATVSPPSNGTPLTATYVVAAPGGSWGDEDNGLYNVTLRDNQVRDTDGLFAPAAVLGAFGVDISVLRFGGRDKATFTDADGDVVTVSLKGPGAGSIQFATDTPADAASIVLSDTTSSSSLTISVKGGTTTFGGLTVNGSLKSISGKSADLAGNMTISGSLPKILLRNARNGVISIGSGPAVSATFDRVADVTFASGPSIKSLKLDDWADTPSGGDDLLSAPSIVSLSVADDFAADVVTGSIGKAKVGGTLDGSRVRSSGSIGSFTAGSMRNGLVFAGVQTGVTTLPESIAEFASTSAELKTLSVKGKSAGDFTSTLIAAPVIGKVTIPAIASSNAGQIFGLTGGRISSLSGATDAAGKFKFSKLDEPVDALTVGDLRVRVR